MKGIASVGDVLAGKYRVDKILGIGGMGMVVQAMHLELEQKVALKFMLPQALESAEASARFMREARAAGKLTGEHICRVIDVGRFASGAPYIVMEYLDGYDLMTLLKRRGPLPIEEAVDYILQACEGMAEAHAVGIVHRDLKPDNLFLATRVDGTKLVKVLDFGISKAAVTGLATKTGDVLGSPAFMAPEQMQATKSVDARADIWSLGVVLHQLLSGKLAFRGDTLPQLCMAVLNDPPKSLTELRKDIPPALADAVLRCLEKDRDARFSDVVELAHAIAPFAGPTAVGAVTRVHSLYRGRATPQTLPPTAEELASGEGDVLPTLAGSLPEIPRPPPTIAMRANQLAPEGPGTTTLASSAGQSLHLPARRGVPIGVLGALIGAVGMIAVIAVMVMRRAANEAPSERPAPPPAPSGLKIEPIREPAPEPSPPAPAAPAAGSAAVEVAPVRGEAHVGEPGDPPKQQTRRTAELPANALDAGSAGSATAAPPDAATPPPDTATEDDEDKWGKMLDDRPGAPR